MKVKRKIIEIDEDRCDGCGECVPACAEGAIQIIDGKAKLVSEKYCDGLGACLGECPKDALRIVEREVEEFDEEAVKDHLESKGTSSAPGEPLQARVCPSAQVRVFDPAPGGFEAEESASPARAQSALSHWPLQIRLVPPTAPFLKGAHLLVAADCTPVAYPRFHRDFLKGRVVMVGCPKFDDVQQGIQKFADIFRNAEIRSITVVVMEVPCCQGMPVIVKRGLEEAGKKIPMEVVVVSIKGEVLSSSPFTYSRF